jgi:hypothetical protein
MLVSTMLIVDNYAFSYYVFSETGEFKIDTTGTYHGMTINSLTEDVPKPRSQAPVVAKQPSTAPRNAVANDKATAGGKPNRKGERSSEGVGNNLNILCQIARVACTV